VSRSKPAARLFTANAIVLLLIADDPGIRLEALADRAGIDGRHVLRILSALEAAGYITRKGSTRLDATYAVHVGSAVHEPPVETTIGKLLAAFERLNE
jgi:hypothetical protein